MEPIDEYHSDDDTYSIGGDSGFSVGKHEDDDDSFNSFTEEIEPLCFFSRVSSIPIIHDGLNSAQQYVRQNSVGKKALDFAESRIQPYLMQNSVINTIGNKSLDMIERQFPIIVKPTDELVSENLNPRIDYITQHLESLMNQYLPETLETKDEKEKQGVDRFKHVVNSFTTRASKLISEKLSATAEEEKQLKKLVHMWIIEQVTTVTEHPPLKQQMEHVYEFAQVEITKFRQELFNTEVGHMDRIRNILVLSQTDILMPLYQTLFAKHQ